MASAITIPASVTNIATQAFYDCSKLKTVYFQGNAPALGSSVFSGDTLAMADYLPGTAGWAAFNAASGLAPALLWKQSVLGSER